MAGVKKPIKAFVANITRHGIGLYTQRSLPIARSVTVTLYFVDHRGREAHEKIRGKVVWSRKAHAAGIALAPLKPKTQPLLLTFLLALEKSPDT